MQKSQDISAGTGNTALPWKEIVIPPDGEGGSPTKKSIPNRNNPLLQDQFKDMSNYSAIPNNFNPVQPKNNTFFKPDQAQQIQLSPQQQPQQQLQVNQQNQQFQKKQTQQVNQQYPQQQQNQLQYIMQQQQQQQQQYQLQQFQQPNQQSFQQSQQLHVPQVFNNQNGSQQSSNQFEKQQNLSALSQIKYQQGSEILSNRQNLQGSFAAGGFNNGSSKFSQDQLHRGGMMGGSQNENAQLPQYYGKVKKKSKFLKIYEGQVIFIHNGYFGIIKTKETSQKKQSSRGADQMQMNITWRQFKETFAQSLFSFVKIDDLIIEIPLSNKGTQFYFEVYFPTVKLVSDQKNIELQNYNQLEADFLSESLEKNQIQDKFIKTSPKVTLWHFRAFSEAQLTEIVTTNGFWKKVNDHQYLFYICISFKKRCIDETKNPPNQQENKEAERKVRELDKEHKEKQAQYEKIKEEDLKLLEQERKNMEELDRLKKEQDIKDLEELENKKLQYEQDQKLRQEKELLLKLTREKIAEKLYVAWNFQFMQGIEDSIHPPKQISQAFPKAANLLKIQNEFISTSKTLMADAIFQYLVLPQTLVVNGSTGDDGDNMSLSIKSQQSQSQQQLLKSTSSQSPQSMPKINQSKQIEKEPQLKPVSNEILSNLDPILAKLCSQPDPFVQVFYRDSVLLKLITFKKKDFTQAQSLAKAFHQEFQDYCQLNEDCLEILRVDEYFILRSPQCCFLQHLGCVALCIAIEKLELVSLNLDDKIKSLQYEEQMKLKSELNPIYRKHQSTISKDTPLSIGKSQKQSPQSQVQSPQNGSFSALQQGQNQQNLSQDPLLKLQKTQEQLYSFDGSQQMKLHEPQLDLVDKQQDQQQLLQDGQIPLQNQLQPQTAQSPLLTNQDQQPKDQENKQKEGNPEDANDDAVYNDMLAKMMANEFKVNISDQLTTEKLYEFFQNEDQVSDGKSNFSNPETACARTGVEQLNVYQVKNNKRVILKISSQDKQQQKGKLQTTDVSQQPSQKQNFIVHLGDEENYEKYKTLSTLNHSNITVNLKHAKVIWLHLQLDRDINQLIQYDTMLSQNSNNNSFTSIPSSSFTSYNLRSFICDMQDLKVAPVDSQEFRASLKQYSVKCREMSKLLEEVPKSMRLLKEHLIVQVLSRIIKKEYRMRIMIWIEEFKRSIQQIPLKVAKLEQQIKLLEETNAKIEDELRGIAAQERKRAVKLLTQDQVDTKDNSKQSGQDDSKKIELQNKLASNVIELRGLRQALFSLQTGQTTNKQNIEKSNLNRLSYQNSFSPVSSSPGSKPGQQQQQQFSRNTPNTSTSIFKRSFALVQQDQSSLSPVNNNNSNSNNNINSDKSLLNNLTNNNQQNIDQILHIDLPTESDDNNNNNNNNTQVDLPRQLSLLDLTKKSSCFSPSRFPRIDLMDKSNQSYSLDINLQELKEPSMKSIHMRFSLFLSEKIKLFLMAVFFDSPLEQEIEDTNSIVASKKNNNVSQLSKTSSFSLWQNILLQTKALNNFDKNDISRGLFINTVCNQIGITINDFDLIQLFNSKDSNSLLVSNPYIKVKKSSLTKYSPVFELELQFQENLNKKLFAVSQSTLDFAQQRLEILDTPSQIMIHKERKKASSVSSPDGISSPSQSPFSNQDSQQQMQSSLSQQQTKQQDIDLWQRWADNQYDHDDLQLKIFLKQISQSFAQQSFQEVINLKVQLDQDLNKFSMKRYSPLLCCYSAWLGLGYVPKALKILEEITELISFNFCADHLLLLRPLEELGNFYIRKKMFTDGLNLYKKCETICYAFIGYNHPKTALYSSVISELIRQIGSVKESIQYYEKTYDMFSDHDNTQQKSIISTLLHLSELYLQERDYRHASEKANITLEKLTQNGDDKYLASESGLALKACSILMDCSFKMRVFLQDKIYQYTQVFWQICQLNNKGVTSGNDQQINQTINDLKTNNIFENTTLETVVIAQHQGVVSDCLTFSILLLLIFAEQTYRQSFLILLKDIQSYNKQAQIYFDIQANMIKLNKMAQQNKLIQKWLFQTIETFYKDSKALKPSFDYQRYKISQQTDNKSSIPLNLRKVIQIAEICISIIGSENMKMLLSFDFDYLQFL